MEEENSKRKAKILAQEEALLEKKSKIDTFKHSLFGYEMRVSQEKFLNGFCNLWASVNQTTENYLRQQSEKILKLKKNSELNQKNLLKSKEIEEKQFNEHISKFVENLMKKEEVLKSKKI